MTEPDKTFPNWNDLYKQPVETMPWYNKDLDADLEDALDTTKITDGRFLDLGTGPGTQAVQSAKRGFEVTGADLSENAINKARKLSDKVNFIVDDILDSKLGDKQFDYVFDRGCFHVMPVKERQKYVKEIKRILNDNGILFLKCFSIKEARDNGPHRFSKDEIKDVIVHWPDGHQTEGIERHIEDLKTMFVYAPDTRIQEHPIKVASGEWTSVIGVMEGTFTEPMPLPDGHSIPPTGKPFKLIMCTVGYWKDGVMVEEYLFWDNQAFMKQIGLTQ